MPGLPSGSEKRINCCSNSVEIVRSVKGFKHRGQAERWLADRLCAVGKTRRGKRFTGRMLKKLHEYSKKRK